MPIEIRIKVLQHLNGRKRREYYEQAQSFLKKAWTTIHRKQRFCGDGLAVTLKLPAPRTSLTIYRYPTWDVEVKKFSRTTLWSLCNEIDLHVRVGNRLKLVPPTSNRCPAHLRRALAPKFARILREREASLQQLLQVVFPLHG